MSNDEEASRDVGLPAGNYECAEPAFTLDHLNRITFWNGACAALFGRSSAEVLGRACYEVVLGDDIHNNLNTPLARLTRRELDVIHCLAKGMTTRRIAKALSITSTTVRNHVQSILQKLNVHTRSAAVSLAYRNGLIASD